MVLEGFGAKQPCCDCELTPEDPQFRITPTQQMAAACSGALITSLFVTPLDVVKIRLQAQQKTLLTNKCFLYCNGLMDHLCTCVNGNGTQDYWYKRPSHFNGTIVSSQNRLRPARVKTPLRFQDAFVKIAKTEGVQSLWSGLSPTLVLALPATVVYFVTYEQLRIRLVDWSQKERNEPQPIWAPLIAGCTARLWAATIVSPLELIRTKMQSKRLSYLEMHEAIKALIKYHGWQGLWKGIGPTLLRDVPFSGIYWVTYEKFKTLNRSKQTNFAFCFLGGSIAGSLAAFVTTPFDVVKTYRQIEMAEKEIITEPPSLSKKSTYSVMSNIYRRNGLSGLFTGLMPRIIKVAPACAIMVATFEYGKQFFQNHNMNEYKKNHKHNHAV
ncbi:solute carrier family 25 member 40-like isoform X2 [Cimex lectularius]|uniref:Mitochondrial carrier protein n=1 Tax=Cimex lectularius TaxID=79782 RepID=A0A8I6TN25_CIMLE|nr:solute carrier family 25 member 40-like isoform X2 [Cimex lectularius]